MEIKQKLAILFVLFSGVAQASPEIQHWETQNGANVYFVAAPELPMVDIQIVFDAGAARDGDKKGVAVLTNGLLAEGAGKLNADQIAEKFDMVGAQFSNSSHRDMAVVGLRSLSDPASLDPALETLTTVLTQPTFPVAAFERVRKSVLISITQHKQSPSALGSEAFYGAVYKDHPYASEPSGEAETVKKLTVADLSQFYGKYYVARNAIIAVVGNLDRAAAERVVNQIVGQMPEGAAADPVPQVNDINESQTIKIEHPSAQTHVMVGQPGVKRGDSDYFDMYVGNHILGGSGLVSRLSDEIREKRGLSYSTYSSLHPMRASGPYIFGLQTRNESAQEALGLLMTEVKKFVEKGPTAEELQAAKRNITGGFPMEISSNQKIVSYIAMIGFYRLPLDYLANFNKKIEAVSLESIKQAFKTRVHPDKLITVLVGRSAKS